MDNEYKLSRNRRSYNDHKGSDNFIDLLNEESTFTNEQYRPSSLQQNIQLPNVVLHNGKKLLQTNGKACLCLPSKEHLQRSAYCGFKKSLRGNMSVVGEFASQTLKPFSNQNLELIAVDDQNGNATYKLKETTSPGCLRSKNYKSMKLQRKGSYKTVQKFNGSNYKERDDNSVSEKNSSDKVRRKFSFISSVIKLAKFGRQKKRSSEKTQETNEDWGTEFIFGGVRVFYDENGKFCEVDQDEDYYDDQSSSMFSSDNESESDGPTRRCRRTKFESSDSLNLGYSGSFVT